MKYNQKLIKAYIKNLDSSVFGVSEIKDIKIKNLPLGNWNFSYMVKVDGRKFAFKLYPQNISDSFFKNTGKNEFLILKLIRDEGISPKPVYFDESRGVIDCSVLIYEYAEGRRLTKFSDAIIREIAEIFSKIHSLNTEKADFIEKKSHHTLNLIQEIEKYFKNYKRQDNAEKEEIELFSGLIEKAKNHVFGRDMPYPETIIHTDPVPSNFIISKKVILIDWQRPAIGDPAFDVWAFLSEPFNLHDLKKTITKKQKELFFKTYLNLREDSSFRERITLKEPLYLLHLALYCLIRYSDYKSGRIPAEILKGRKANFERYNRTKKIIVERLRRILY